LSSLTLKPNTLLVDGENLIKRAFLGAKDVYSEEFGHIGGLYQFMSSLRQQIKLHNINKCLVLWDGDNSGKMRYNVYPKYKANRTSKDWYKKVQLTDKQIAHEGRKKESILKQRIRIKQYLEELFIRQLEVEFIEADDLIAYYCKLYSENENITIYTNDRDMFQLMGYDNVSVYIVNKKILVNKESYFLEFEHHYKNAKLMKILCGDPSDNIKGVKGLGETGLLKKFPEINKVPLTYDDILDKTKILIKEREENKKKPLQVFNNIIKGINTDGEVLGTKLYEVNDKIVNLMEPMMNKQAIHELKEISELPIDDYDRGSKNLLEYMKKDGFLSFYFKNFIIFVEGFYPVIIREKELLKNFETNER
jgi:5'-3' exonuclease